jgi:citrate synthase
MPTDLKSMLRAADSHDRLVGIEHRDLPQAEPRDHELREMAADLWRTIKREFHLTGFSDLADRLAEDRIRTVLLEVRHAATSGAAINAWNRAVELLR